MADNTMDRDFIEHVVKMLVDNPDDVKVERKVDELGVLITLDVNPTDMGMVIGREGMTAKALRTLLRVIGARHNARVNLKINEPEGGARPPRRERTEEGAVHADEAPSEELSAETEPASAPAAPEKRTLDDVMNDIRL